MLIRGSNGGPYETDSWPTPTPGLVIVRTSTNHFTVTHQRSGLMVAASESPENAMRLAVDFAGQVDWTRHGAELCTDPDAKVAFRAMRSASDLGAVGPNPITVDDLDDLNPP